MPPGGESLHGLLGLCLTAYNQCDRHTNMMYATLLRSQPSKCQIARLCCRRKERAARRAAQKTLWGPPPPATLTSTLSGELVSNPAHGHVCGWYRD
jgi:hypothetical protein